MEKEITIGEKTYKAKSITYLQALDVEELREKSLRDSVKKFLQFSTGISDEELENLSIQDGLSLQKLVNSINSDFQTPVKD